MLRRGQRGRRTASRARSGPTTLDAAHRTGVAVEAGYVWINEVGQHFLGAPFGGFKQSGIGREECIEELMAFTQEKNIHMRFKA